MIVRNEEKILARSLSSIAPYICAYVICDTGSTDNTVSLIKGLMHEYNIPGEVHEIPFKSFSQARNDALDKCRESKLEFDHILLSDADMELVVESPSALDNLDPKMDGQMIQKSGGLEYWNTRIVARASGNRYVGATHEFITSPHGNTEITGAYFVDHACGSNRSEKYERDERLLLGELQEKPNDERSMFYLARTYLETGQYEKAIEWFTKRIDAGGWDEEQWHSMMSIADCYKRMGNEDMFVSYSLKAYDKRPTRGEPITKLAEYFYDNKKAELAVSFAKQCLDIPYPQHDKLFIETQSYHWRPKMIVGVMGFYSRLPEHKNAGANYCADLMIPRTGDPDWLRDMSAKNFLFYGKSIQQIASVTTSTSLSQVPGLPEGYVQSSPSIIQWKDGKYLVNVRCVNYKIREDGSYSLPGNTVETRNFLSVWDPQSNTYTDTVEIECDSVPNKGNIHGLEDIRLIDNNGVLMGSASYQSEDWGIRTGVFTIDPQTGKAGNFSRASVPWDPDVTEKNWMPFVHENKCKFMYSSFPCRSFSVTVNDQGGITMADHVLHDHGTTKNTVRGGSQLVKVGNKWLAVVHEVIYDTSISPRRIYVHRFAEYDNNTLNITRISNPWWFSRKPDIEFCCGMSLTHDGQSLIIPFSVMDTNASFITVPVESALSLLRPI